MPLAVPQPSLHLDAGGIVEELHQLVAQAGAWLSAGTPLPEAWQLALALLAGAVAALLNLAFLGGAANQLVTVVHESGHALVAVVTGRHVTRIRIERDGSGSTHHLGRPGGLGSIFVSFAGYPFPGIIGCALILAAVSGHARLWVALAALGLLLLLRRTGNLHGWLTIGATLAALGAAAWWLPGSTLAAVTAGLGMLLLAGALRDLQSERRSRRAGQRGSDIEQLAGRGRIPAGIWWTAMLCVVLGCGWFTWLQVASVYAVG